MAASIVGVSGFMRTGKDSVATLLGKFGYRRISFADPLRKVAYDIDPFISLEGASDEVRSALGLLPAGSGIAAYVRYSDLVDTLGYELAKSIPDFRRYLQRVGTEGIRGTFGDDAWVDLAIKTVHNMTSDALFVFPDVRFPNEAQTVRNLGGVIWRTERPGFEGGPHPSESEVLKIIPDVILNASSLLDEDGKPGLGSLVLRQLGKDPTVFSDMLRDWADERSGVVPASA